MYSKNTAVSHLSHVGCFRPCPLALHGVKLPMLCIWNQDCREVVHSNTGWSIRFIKGFELIFEHCMFKTKTFMAIVFLSLRS